jgi:hypothetical protein
VNDLLVVNGLTVELPTAAGWVLCRNGRKVKHLIRTFLPRWGAAMLHLRVLAFSEHHALKMK